MSAAYAFWQVRTASDLAYGRADGLTLHVNDAGGTLAVAVAVCAARFNMGLKTEGRLRVLSVSGLEREREIFRSQNFLPRIFYYLKIKAVSLPRSKILPRLIFKLKIKDINFST